ncbi:hypothetical protein E2562_028550 [Oryza meyeriana var. granulata]|uniref:Uncharacterized protein n=1 Tax=Oryza meyeriana var. granulata TaxID=110450 RepID=A0A6G1EQV0_9ORYZ|nr:hypothetical protein E2562_028550 [Oryza meyeriana var. granulata]
MSGFAGQRSRPWMGDAAASEQAAGDVRDDAGGAAAASAKGLGDASTNASAISFGFAATAILISMFLLMAIFEHLIKPSLSSSSSSSSRTSTHGDGDGHGQSSHSAAADDAVSPDKLFRTPAKMEAVQAEDLTVLMPGQRYPTFLAQPAPLLPWPREGVRWPPHGNRHCFVPP